MFINGGEGGERKEEKEMKEKGREEELIRSKN